MSEVEIKIFLTYDYDRLSEVSKKKDIGRLFIKFPRHFKKW